MAISPWNWLNSAEFSQFQNSEWIANSADSKSTDGGRRFTLTATHLQKKSHLYEKAFVPNSIKTNFKMATILDKLWRHQAIPTLLESTTIHSQETAPIREGVRSEIGEKLFQERLSYWMIAVLDDRWRCRATAIFFFGQINTKNQPFASSRLRWNLRKPNPWWRPHLNTSSAANQDTSSVAQVLHT